MENDWRLSRGQEEYLYGKKLKRIKYPVNSQDPGQHAHCELCYATISPYSGDEHEAYQTEDRRFWICDNYFADFCEKLHLSVEEKQEDSPVA